MPLLDSTRPDTLLQVARDLVERFSALSGLVGEDMVRGPAWRFLDIGRRLERAMATCRMARQLGPPELLCAGGRRGPGAGLGGLAADLLGADRRRDALLREARGIRIDQELGVLAQAPHVAGLREIQEGEYREPDESRQPRVRT